MPREFLKQAHKREQRGEAKAISRAPNDRMMRPVKHKAVRECAPYREECWPEANTQRRD